MLPASYKAKERNGNRISANVTYDTIQND